MDIFRYKATNIINLILWLVLYVVFFLAGFGFGATYQNGALYSGLYWGVFGLLLLIAAANWSIIFFKRKKYGNQSVKQSYERMLREQAEIEKDYKKAERSVAALLVTGYLLAAVVALLSFAMVFLSWAAVDITAVVIAVLICLFNGFGFLSLFTLPVKEPLPELRLELMKEQFPELWNAVRSAAKTVKCRKPFRVFIGDATAVYNYRRYVIVSLNALEYVYMSQDEFYNVMLHEFGHVINTDTAKRRRYIRIIMRWSAETYTFPLRFFLYFWLLHFEYASVVFNVVSSRHMETLADDVVRQKGDPQIFVNATAKAEEIGLYCEDVPAEIMYEIFESNRPTEFYLTKKYKSFLRCRERKADKWKKILLYELPAQFDSHPTLRMRMEHMGCTEFKTELPPEDGTYAVEKGILLNKANKAYFISFSEDYESLRAQQYLSRKEAMDWYNSSVLSGKTIDNDMLVLSMQAFDGINNDKVREIAQELLSRDGDSPIAHYYLGLIAFNDLDEQCINHFEKALARPELAADSIQRIGQFAIRTGNRELLEDYRRRAPGIMQKIEDAKDARIWKKKYSLRKCELPAAQLKRIAEKCAQRCEGVVSAVYAATFDGSGGPMHLILLCYKRLVDEEEADECCFRTLRYITECENIDCVVYDRRNKNIYQRITQVSGTRIQ